MRVHESFEQCATRLYAIARAAEAESPGAPRILFLDIQGHRNSAGGFDRDAYEIMSNFLLTFLLNFLTEANTPLCRLRNTKGQVNEFPDKLSITDATESIALPRDHNPDPRRSKPSARAIAEYLGLDEDPGCMICWERPVERAHAQPASLNGSNDVRNFALLCKKHHLMAPDVADSNAFWQWIDWMLELDGFFARMQRPPEVPLEMAFFAEIKRQLFQIYGWSEADLKMHDWTEVMEIQYRVLEQDTGKHFGVDRKASTHAWAFDRALRQLRERS